MSKQKYPTKIFIRVIWPGGIFPHEDLSWTGKFQVNSSLSSCICINNFKFRDSLYLLTPSYPNITGGQYNGRTIYYHPQSQIGCPISSLIHKLGCPKRPIIQIFQYGESPMTQIVHFLTNVGPVCCHWQQPSNQNFLHPKTPFIQVNIFSKSPWLQDTWISPI